MILLIQLNFLFGVSNSFDLDMRALISFVRGYYFHSHGLILLTIIPTMRSINKVKSLKIV